MVCRETAVIGRMPILGRNDQWKRFLQPVRDRDRHIALRNSQSTARQKVILNINKDKSLHAVVFFLVPYLAPVGLTARS